MPKNALSIVTRTGVRISINLIESAPAVQDAILAASEGFGQPIDNALSLDVKQHVESCHFGFQFRQDNGQIAGFTLFKLYGDLLCGGGMMIRPDFQRYGLVKRGIELAHQHTDARFLAYRTQSPRMWSAGKKLCTIWGPDQRWGFNSPDLIDVRKRVAKIMGVNETVTSAVFDRRLYAEKPTHLNSEIQTWWDSICDFERGDMVLCVGKFE